MLLNKGNRGSIKSEVAPNLTGLERTLDKKETKQMMLYLRGSSSLKEADLTIQIMI